MTVRLLADLRSRLSNTRHDNEAQDLRDLLESTWGTQWANYLGYPANTLSIDEFQDETFSGWTTVTVTGGQTITEGRDVLSVQPTSAINVTDWNCVLQPHAIQIGDAVEVAVVGLLTHVINEPLFGPVITNGTTSAAVMAAHMVQQGGAAFGAGIFSYPSGTDATLTANGINTSTSLQYAFANAIYIRTEYQAANTFRNWISYDGVTWLQMGADITATMTPTHVGFGLNTRGETPSGTVISIDYVRIPTV